MLKVYLNAFLILSFSPALAQPTATKDATAISIVQQSLTAMGSGQNFTDVQGDGTTTAYGDSGAVTQPITLQATGTANVRTTITKASGTKTFLTDGSGVCTDGVAVPLSPDAQSDMSLRRIDFVPALSILNHYADPSIQVQYVGADSSSGALADVVALTFIPPGLIPGLDGFQAQQRIFFIDRATSLVSKVQSTSTGASSPQAEVVFAKYQTISGFAVPMDQATYIDGNLAQELSFTSVAFNTGLDSSLFAMTCEVSNGQ